MWRLLSRVHSSPRMLQLNLSTPRITHCIQQIIQRANNTAYTQYWRHAVLHAAINSRRKIPPIGIYSSTQAAISSLLQRINLELGFRIKWNSTSNHFFNAAMVQRRYKAWSSTDRSSTQVHIFTVGEWSGIESAMADKRWGCSTSIWIELGEFESEPQQYICIYINLNAGRSSCLGEFLAAWKNERLGTVTGTKLVLRKLLEKVNYAQAQTTQARHSCWDSALGTVAERHKEPFPIGITTSEFFQQRISSEIAALGLGIPRK